MDLFFFESWKILIRFIVGFLKVYQKEILKLPFVGDIIIYMNEKCLNMTVDEFMMCVFSIKLKNKAIFALEQKFFEQNYSVEQVEQMLKFKNDRKVMYKKLVSQLRKEKSKEKITKESIQIEPQPNNTQQDQSDFSTLPTILNENEDTNTVDDNGNDFVIMALDTHLDENTNSANEEFGREVDD